MFGGRKQGRRNGTVLTAITITLGYVVHVGICCTSCDVLYKLECVVHAVMCCTSWDVLYKLGCAVQVGMCCTCWDGQALLVGVGWT